jgi:hypothetical protein
VKWRPEVIVLALVAAATVFGAAHAAGPEPDGPRALQPYAARYQVSYRGLSGGQIASALSRGTEPGLWRYETRAYPNLFGRIAVSPQARERSSMQVTAAGVRPMTFNFDDGSADVSKDVRFTFDWKAGRVRGEVEGQPLDLEIPPDTQDTASVQAAMIVELLAGRTPTGFPILTGRKLRHYRYWPEGRETVDTPFGRLDTVIWASQRDGSTRVTKVWHAPSLGYVPVQALQYRKGKPEVQMTLVSLERG